MYRRYRIKRKCCCGVLTFFRELCYNKKVLQKKRRSSLPERYMEAKYQMSKKKHIPRRNEQAAEQPQEEKLTGGENVTPAEPEPAEPEAPETADAEETAELKAPETESPAEEAQEPEVPEAEPEKPAAEEANESAETEKAAEKPAAEAEEEYNFQSLLRDIKGITGKAKAAALRYELPELLLTRLIALYFMLSGFWVLYIRVKRQIRAVENWRDFVGVVGSNGMLLCSVIFLISSFVTLSCLCSMLPKKKRIVDQCAAVVSVLFFDVALLWRVNNFFLTTAVAFVSLVFIYYAVVKLPDRKALERLPRPLPLLIVLAAGILVTVFIASGSVYKHKIFGTACHDFGLFVQMFHSLSKNLTAVTTCERDHALSHFYIHSSFIYYLLVPVYKLFPKDETLLIAQAVLAVSGLIPMYLIAKNHNYKGIPLIFLSFMYAFSIGVISPCFYDFHENAFLPALLMWLFYAVDRKKIVFMWIMAFLVCMVKEDAPLYTLCIGLYMFFELKGDKKRWHGLLMAVITGAYMMFITAWLTKNGDGATMTATRFGILMINYDGGLKDVVKNVLLDPSYFFSLLVHEDTLNFFLKMMLPLLFIPFLTKKIHRFWLMMPFIVMNLTIGAGYGYAANVDYQYVFGPICLLLYMVVINLEDFGAEKKHDLSIVLGGAAILFFVGLPLYHLDAKENFIASRDGFTAVDECLDRLPEDGRICATPFLLSHCADREEIYLLDNADTNLAEEGRTQDLILEPDRYDFYVFGPDSELGQFMAPLLEQMGWRYVDGVEHRVAVYQSPSYHG